MTRNLKTLGLALAAMLALGAVAASAASAQQGVLTSDGPVTLDIEESGIKGFGANAFTAFGSKTECFGSSYTGHKYNGTPHELMESGSTTATITPHYNQLECRVTTEGTERPATVAMNGCDYVFHVGETSEVGANYDVTADVVCSGTNKIHITTWPAGTTPAEHATASPLCTVEIGSQSGLEGAEATSVGTFLRVVGAFENITVTRHGLCQAFQATTSFSGKLHVDTSVTGTDAYGEPTDLSISDLAT